MRRETQLPKLSKPAVHLDPFGPPAEWSRPNELWTLDQWQALCVILFNGNTDPHEFLLCFPGEQPKKAVTANVGRHIDWTFKSLAGTAKEPTAIGFYPYNARTRLSCWGGLDFDAHEGSDTKQRAHALAAEATALLRRQDTSLAVIACMSGTSGGWHLFIFADHFEPIEQWQSRLRRIAATMGAPVEPGVCELHPHATDKRPRGLLVPGCCKQCTPALIAYDTLTDRLSEWLQLLNLSPLTGLGRTPKTLICALGVLWVREITTQYAIKAASTRNSRLVQMVAAMVPQCGRELALKAAAQQYRQARPGPQASLNEHLAEFGRAWNSVTRREERKLSLGERSAYKALGSEIKREGLLIIRNWSRASPDESDFYIHCATLAARLGVELSYAAKLRKEFCELGVLRPTAPYVPHKRSARYQWVL